VSVNNKQKIDNHTPYKFDVSDLPTCEYSVMLQLSDNIKYSWNSYCNFKEKLIVIIVNKNITYPHKRIIWYRSQYIKTRHEIKKYGKIVNFKNPIEIMRFAYCYEIGHYIESRYGNYLYYRLKANRFALKYFRK